LNPYIEEAVLITRDLGDATFVGAVAVFLHTGKSRESKDLDLVVAEQIAREQFLDLNYRFINENGKERIYTPRNYKIDVYDSRDLNEIPLNRIIETRATIPIGKSKTVNAICLEGLIVVKYRAKRDQDLADLSLIAMYCFKKIDWTLLRTFTKDDVEFRQIAETMKFYKENPR
jgi:hypothetical protein